MRELTAEVDARRPVPPLRPLEVAEQMSDAVHRLAALWGRAQLSVTPRLSAHQLRALEAVAGAPGINLSGLADAAGTGPPAASRLCDRLEAAGLVDRVVSPTNRREVRLTATAHGHDLLGRISARRQQDLAEVLAAMPEDRRADLLSGLLALHEAERSRDRPGGAAQQ